MYTDKFLKFDSAAAANAVLYTTVIEVLAEDGTVLVSGSVTPKYLNIDTLGTLYAAPPVPLPEHFEPVALAGYHVNVRVMPGEDGAALDPYNIVPAFPRRVFG